MVSTTRIADQAERARQVLGQVDDLRALHADGRLDLVARDDRPGRGRHHPHFDAEVLELLLDQARGHLQRLGAHRGLLALRRRVEQVDLRQLGVDQLAEERLLPFLDDARALGHVDQRRLDHDRQMLLVQLVLDFHRFLALADRLLADAGIFFALDARDAAQAQRVDARADRLGHAQPRKAEAEGDAGDEHCNPEHARPGEAKKGLARPAQRVAEHAAGVAAGDLSFVRIEPRPLQRRAGHQQQGQAEPDRPGALRLGCGRPRRVGAQNARQAAEPGAATDQDRPPDRVAGQEVRQVREPGTGGARLVLQRAAGARSREARVGAAVRRQGDDGQDPGHGSHEETELRAP